MTFRQYGTLKYVMESNLDTNDVSVFNLTTFGSLLHNGWIRRRGNIILVTQEGLDAYEQYAKAEPNYRKHESNIISERVRMMLDFGRRNGSKRK